MERNSSYKNRELSWLQFNERVLNEAGNSKTPLAEKLTFISIYQKNLDEFFMVRVGTLMVQSNSKEEIRENKTWMTSREQVNAILERVKELEIKKTEIYDNLMKELHSEGLSIINFNKLSSEDAALLEKYFDTHIAPFLSPIIVNKHQMFPFLDNKELYAIVLLEKNDGKSRIGIVPCTNTVFKRLIGVPSHPGSFMLCEELILHFVSKLFDRYNIVQKSVMRVTRNADIDAGDVYDEDLDYRDVMEHLIRQRKRLSPVRLELSRDINENTLEKIALYLGIEKNHIIRVNTPLDFSFTRLLQNYLSDKTELFYKQYSPRLPAGINVKESLIKQIEQKDILLSYPFESMKPFMRLLNDAAEDESVVAIMITLYRVADRSKVIELLSEAAENGKKVIVLVELRARFDEENNIEMSKRLEEAGCNIIYGLGEYKVHSKLCLIVRKTEDGISYITQIGTGNYNEETSRMYTDFSLLTANPAIGEDASQLFKALMQGKPVEHTEQLLVAPKELQNGILRLMDEQIVRASHGGDGYIGIKINALTDRALIEKFIEASRAGVKIELIVRGICCLIPDIPGQTDNITVVSIVGRFLEHSRIYRFGKGKDEKIFIASADFMTRNTTRRVEVAVPVFDEDAKKKLKHVFDTLMADTENGSIQTSDGLYKERLPQENEARVNSQELLFEEAYKAEADAAKNSHNEKMP
ncbi:MAG: polyphosphate kinase 1 [Treponemataceae bacterium]|nr:polyphosphate kinase 1 [Treponemataceae bacterium]